MTRDVATRIEFVSVVTFIPNGDESRAAGSQVAAGREEVLNSYGRMGYRPWHSVSVVRAEDVQIIDTLQRETEVPGARYVD